MYAMHALVFCLLFQTPSPTVQPKNPVIKNGASANRENATKKERKSKLPPSKPENVSIPSAIQNKTAENQAQDKSHERPYRVKVLSQPDATDPPLFLPYLIVTALGVFVNAFIWVGIRNQTKLNWHQVRINIFSARAAMRSARAAKQSADAARDNVGSLGKQLIEMQKAAEAAKKSADTLVASERAWIMVEIKPQNMLGFIVESVELFKESTNVAIECICSNQGKTPAWITAKDIGIAIYDNELPKEPELLLTWPYQTEVEPMAASQVSKLKINVECNGRGGPGKKTIIFGIIRYRDIFGNERYSTVGYFLTLDHTLDRIPGHPEYNMNT